MGVSVASSPRASLSKREVWNPGAGVGAPPRERWEAGPGSPRDVEEA
jgi:hypothetical protein